MKKNFKSLFLAICCFLNLYPTFCKNVEREKFHHKEKNNENYNERNFTSPEGLEDSADYKIRIFNATASSFQPGGEVSLSYDGDTNTIYHSNWNGGGFPITLTYNFLNTSEVNYLIYYPRTDGGSNGNFGKTEIWYATESDPKNFIKVTNFDFQFTDTARRVNFPTALQNVTSLRVVVDSGYNNLASCAEMEFYSKMPPPQPNVYKAGNTNEVTPDKTIVAVTGATATNFQPGGEVVYSFDNDFTTIYHSNWEGGGFPITLTYNLAQTDSINFMEYYPRQDGGDNGNFGKLEVLYSTQNAPDQFTSLGDFGFKESAQASIINFTKALVKPAKIKVVVKSGKNNFASCAEMRFYKKNTSPVPAVFTDATCSQLKSGVTQAVIDTMSNAFYKNIAQALFNGTYQSAFRVQSYEAYPTVESTAAQLKTSGYNPFENPTGIVFTKDEEVVVFVSDSLTKAPQLTVVNMESGSFETSRYILNKGINKITIQNSGLGYISYYYDDWKTLPRIKINIAGGVVNGYFDVTKNTNTDWTTFLKQTVYGAFDIVGKEVSLNLNVDALRNYTPDDGVSLINLFDSIVHTEHEQMGLITYNRLPKNRMFGATTPNGGWRAGGIGALFDITWGVSNLTSVTGVRNSIWGIAHEFGHVNQIRPDLKWLGTTEVTNNIYSLWCSRKYGVGYTRYRLETESEYDGFGNWIPGGRYNAYLNEGIIKGIRYQMQNHGDPFVKLTPLWQLMMYYQIAGEGNAWYKPDWFEDLAERARNTNSQGVSDGQLQLNFMKNTCDMVQQDLTNFFKKTGMLQPIDTTIDDYGVGSLTITQAGCDSVVKYASKYPKPLSPVIYYLNINSIDAYKNKAAIIGTTGIGVTISNNTATINHQQWKNVAVFEIYKNDTLVRASIYGSGSDDNSSTTLYLPDTSVRIYAVGWDGSKKLVYPSGGVLAVNPVVLQATASGKEALVSWSVLDEKNIQTYQLQHSLNNQVYTTLTTVPATGYKIYTYKDVNAKIGSEPNYYRIKMTDNQGKVSYSNVETVTINDGSVVVFPVPFTSVLNIKLAASNVIKHVRLINMASGTIVQPVFKQQNNLITIQSNNLKPGSYLLQLIDKNGKIYAEKVMKQ